MKWHVAVRKFGCLAGVKWQCLLPNMYYICKFHPVCHVWNMYCLILVHYLNLNLCLEFPQIIIDETRCNLTNTEKKVEPKRWSYFRLKKSEVFWKWCHFRGWNHFFPKHVQNVLVGINGFKKKRLRPPKWHRFPKRLQDGALLAPLFFLSECFQFLRELVMGSNLQKPFLSESD